MLRRIAKNANLQTFVRENLRDDAGRILQTLELLFQVRDINGHLLRLQRKYNGQTETNAARDDAHLKRDGRGAGQRDELHN
jgi:hypothetical protein